MTFFYSLLQIIGWIGVGYNIKGNNVWAIFAFVLFSLFMGLVGVMNMVGKEMVNGNSSKH